MRYVVGECLVYSVLQAKVVDLRTELCDVDAAKSVIEKESHNLLLQLHASQLQLHSKPGSDADSDMIKKKLVSFSFSFSID